LALIRTQEKLLDKDDKIYRLNKQLNIEFEMTRTFMSQFMKDIQVPILKTEHKSLPDTIIDYKRKNSDILNIKNKPRNSDLETTKNI
jgi:hypothetical protein